MDNLLSLALYIACFLTSALLLSIGIKRSNRLVKLIAVSLPILLVGLRVDVGTDYASYVAIFQQYSGTTISNTINTEVEIGFVGLMSLAALFTHETWLIFLLSAIITIGIAYMAINRLSPKNTPLAFLLYLFVMVPFVMNGVRQGIAVSIVFLAYSYIIRGKPLKYLLTIAIASLFHTSAIALLPLYFLRYVAVKKRTDAPFTLLISILIAALSILLIPLSLLIITSIPALSTYARYEGWESGIAWAPLAIMTILVIIVVVSYSYLTRIFPVMQLMAALLFLELSALFLGGLSAAISRMSFYLTIGGLVYMANIPSIFTRDTRRIVQFIVVAYGILYFTFFFYINGYSDIFPYKIIWLT